MNCKAIRNAVSLSLAVAVSSALLFVGCGGDDDDGNNGDSGDGGSYTYTGGVVTIGSQKWMKKNLDRATADSKCYNNSADSCAKYGRLYTWDDAKTACPSGWHLPSDGEWETLMTSVGGASTAGTKLKSTSGWNNNGNGTDQYGFAALPGGYGSSSSYFSNAGSSGRWWSASEDDASTAYGRYMYYSNESTNWLDSDKSSLFSVRCVQ